MNNFNEIIVLFLTAINSIAIAFVRWEAKKNGLEKQPDHTVDELWKEILDIRAMESKIIQGMNKWLRRQGRTIQAATEKADLDEETPASISPKKFGMIIKKH